VAPSKLDSLRDRVSLSPQAVQVSQDKQAEEVAKAGKTVDDDQVENDPKLKLIKMMIEALTGKKVKVADIEEFKAQASHTVQESSSASVQASSSASEQVDERESGEGFGLVYESRESHYESEQLSFSAEGTIKTKDGLEMDLQMSREYATENSFSLRMGDAAKIDPLVLNYSGSAASLTDLKFSFDLDMDGSEENISFVRPGSGFLVLDRNHDGKVNNGSELFGPRTGNGFAELAVHDEDANGWIDEDDSIFEQLQVWTKNEAGEDRLSSLKSMGVGAVYLSSVDSKFDLKDVENNLDGQVSRSGIYLEEEGGVKTIQQLDLVV
jgi:hypothetical protein